MYPYRIFVSYSHENKTEADVVRARLREIGARPLSDLDLPPGLPFTDEIKRRIGYAHVFVPLLTEDGSRRPWVHQEIGYAMGMGVPVLPLAIGHLPEGMAQQLHAVVVKPDLTDLGNMLTTRSLETVVARSAETVSSAFRCAANLRERTKTLVAYARGVLELGEAGRVKQKTAFGSFSIPNKDACSRWFDRRDGVKKRSAENRELLRQEREVMEEHARQKGCDLILDPVAVKQHDRDGTLVRIEVLLEFFESMDDEKLRVVMPEGQIDRNLILVDDWFLSEAIVPFRGDSYMVTTFTSHGPTVLDRSRSFDREFAALLEEADLRERSSRVAAIDKLKTILADLKK